MARKKPLRAPYGQLQDDNTIKFFILYVIKSLGGHASKAAIDEVALLTESANYFDYAIHYADLVDKELILEVEYFESRVSTLSSAGVFALEQFEKSIPFSTRARVDKAVLEHRARIQYEKDICSEVTTREDGSYDVTLIINDHDMEIFRTTINMPIKDVAEEIGRKFKKNPTPIYKNLMETIATIWSDKED